MSDTVKLVTTKPDAEIAEELKKEVVEASEPLLKALHKAKELGFSINVGFGPDFLGRIVVVNLQVSKVY